MNAGVCASLFKWSEDFTPYQQTQTLMNHTHFLHWAFSVLMSKTYHSNDKA